jgi:hypothetical protein
MSDPGKSDDERLGHYLTLWQQAVQVQMHFNDLEWRIRGLALTALTFALGAAALAAKDGTTIGGASLGSLLLVPGLVLWLAFFYVDRYWYHPLLKAAGDEANSLEDAIRGLLPDSYGLSTRITERSAYKGHRLVVRLLRDKPTEDGKVHSDDKIKRFYVIGAAAIVILIIVLQVATSLADTGDSNQDEPARSEAALSWDQ